ncbi:MAG: hypothetical protein CM1200mP28_11200 [Deltaproteobacteria bacterium]|nr:MAG: hypothetical protein CM1200mP28_11200 [Deltaproteobacteria bacterium]
MDYSRGKSAGHSGVEGFPAEPGRYHLYVSLACPWAHRTLIFRKLKSLEDIVAVSIVHPHMLDQGGVFLMTGKEKPGTIYMVTNACTSTIPEQTLNTAVG